MQQSRTHSALGVAAAALLLAALGSCIPQPVPLTGTLDVEGFLVRARQTQRIVDDVTIHVAGSVKIAGRIEPQMDAGQSITIQAEGDVTISGAVIAGDGPVGSAGGSVTIISLNGDITLAGGVSISAGRGGAGQFAEQPATLTDPNGMPIAGRMLTGGAGAPGGSVTLRAPNGSVTLANKPGIIHIGDGGDGVTFQVHGQDLLNTELVEPLENAGGDSGDFVVEAATFNGTPLLAGTQPPLDATLFSGGQGGDAGGLFWGVDENGNSTWPDVSTATQRPLRSAGVDAAGEKRSDLTHRKIFSDLRRSGAKGGDGYLHPGTGKSVRIRGRSARAFGGDGQNAFAFGGFGGNCKSPLCLEGGNGGSADATGGNGAVGRHPTGTGGDGGKGDATGGLGGVGLVNNGRHGDARAFGGNGGKGGGLCNNNVADRGGSGGFGGAAFASADKKTKAIAVAGNGGDGGDGRKFSGPVGGVLLASAFGGPSSVQTQGKKGNPGATCPRVRALAVSALSSIPLAATAFVEVACITGAEVSPPDDGCNCEHVHGDITIPGVGGPFKDPDPSGCGHGCVQTVLKSLVDVTCP